ncbi:MAG: heavy metal-binding domain-containing protein [Firmicutes bacterium]|nr:heavy metal-binding domain-containing protein [Bacillota bacterium]
MKEAWVTSDNSSYQDIPADALERLNRESGHYVFTSDLTVNEFVLVDEAGFEPLGLVMGSSIYHIGYQQSAWSKNQEMTVLSQAMYNARELAMSRMEEEADALKADGIIGVRLEVKHAEWGQHLAEFIAIGTAVRAKDGQSHRTIKNKPFTSDLSGQDFWTLMKTGYRPVSLVMGSCVYHIAHQGMMQMLRQVGQNQEMTIYTQGLYDARELAMERMQLEAADLQADGIVGVHLHESSHQWGSHVIEFFAVGTAVKRFQESQLKTPSLVLPLNDPGL